MNKISFKCPACNQKVLIEGTHKKICPYCGWIERDIRKPKRNLLGGLLK